MNRSSFALFVALLIHMLLLLLFWMLGSMTPDMQKLQKPKEHRMKVSLKEVPKVSKDAGMTKKKIKPPKIAPAMPKGEQLKKIVKPVQKKSVKKPPIKYKPKKKPTKPKLNKKPTPTPPKKQPKKQPKIEPLPPEKPYIPLIEPKKEKPVKKEIKEDPMAWMYEDKSTQESKENKITKRKKKNITNDIKKLYGETFGKLTDGQQRYIIDNQEIMRRITQQVLIRVASVNLNDNMNVNRTNIIEFYLYPDGSMSDFKFLKKSGYYFLDATTQETIEYAYKDYPRPTEKTLIRYNVYYNLARY